MVNCGYPENLSCRLVVIVAGKGPEQLMWVPYHIPTTDTHTKSACGTGYGRAVKHVSGMLQITSEELL
jgi:hypothetical protein